MAKFSKLEILASLGFNRNPFRGVTLKTMDNQKIKRTLSMAVKERAMVAVCGERGTGKTKSIMDALRDLNVNLVMVLALDKARLLIGDIMSAMIMDLSDETPRRGAELRARQLRRVLGVASRKQDIVVLIEEGHRLHPMTLRALKSLRELDWMGETELFTTLMLCQSDPINKPGVSEVMLRTDAIHMNGLTFKEVIDYVKATVGKVFSPEAVTSVARLPGAKNFLDLQNILTNLMGRALAAGRDMVQPEDVAAEFGIGREEKREELKEKPGDLERSHAPDRKTVSDALRTVAGRMQGENAPMQAVG